MTVTAPQHLQLAVVAVVAVQAGGGVVGVHASLLIQWWWCLTSCHSQYGAVEWLLLVFHLLRLGDGRSLVLVAVLT